MNDRLDIPPAHGTITKLATCACGQPATSGSSRNECGECFRRRLGSVQLDPAATATRTKRNYYDRAAVADQFGADAKDRMMDATKGVGAGRRDSDGRVWHQNRKTGDYEPLSDAQVRATYLDGPEVADPLMDT